MEIGTPEELRKAKEMVVEKVRHYINLANNKWNINLSMPKVEFNISGRVAGRAWSSGRIQFNPTIIALNPDEFLERTPGHEVAHMVTFIRYPEASGHGDEWTHVMWNFKLPAVRCHNYDIGTNDTKKKIVTPIRRDGMIIKSSKVGSVIECE